MTIKAFNQMQNTLKSYDMKNWTKSIETGNRFNLNDAPGINEGGSETKSFGDFLSESIGKVNSLQEDANTAMQKLASGESKNLHETLLAVERADIAFRQMNQVRMKVIDAYKEIMKMQV